MNDERICARNTELRSDFAPRMFGFRQTPIDASKAVCQKRALSNRLWLCTSSFRLDEYSPSPLSFPALPSRLYKSFSQLRSFRNPLEQCPEASLVFQSFCWHSYFNTPSYVASLNHLLEFTSDFDFFNFEPPLSQMSAYAGQNVP